MSMTNEKFANGVKEIVHQKTLIASANEQIKSIKETLHEEEGFDKKELGKYADKLFQKLEKGDSYHAEADLMTRVYEEIDNYDA